MLDSRILSDYQGKIRNRFKQLNLFRQPVDDLGDGDDSVVEPLCLANVFGVGRDRRFNLPQYFIRLNGMRTAFFDAGQGRVIFFIHGLAANLTHWVNVAPHFMKSHRVVGLDLWGCGESDKPGIRYSVDLYVDQVRRLMNELEIEKATIVGHSLGGMIASQFATDYPSRVESLVLLCPGGMEQQSWLAKVGSRLTMKRSLLAALLPRTWQRLLNHVMHENNTFTDAFRRSYEQTYDPDVAGQIAHVIVSLRPDLVDRYFGHLLEDIRMPLWMLWGKRDALVSPAAMRRLVAKLPKAKTQELSACGHMPMIEQPHRVISFLSAALGR